MAIGAFTVHAWIHKKLKIPKMRYFLTYYEFTCTIFLKTFFGEFSYVFLALFIAVNEVNSKHSQTSRSVVKFQEKSSFSRIFKSP